MKLEICIFELIQQPQREKQNIHIDKRIKVNLSTARGVNELLVNNILIKPNYARSNNRRHNRFSLREKRN